jgi:hypothetical protein
LANPHSEKLGWLDLSILPQFPEPGLTQAIPDNLNVFVEDKQEVDELARPFQEIRFGGEQVIHIGHGFFGSAQLAQYRCPE